MLRLRLRRATKGIFRCAENGGHGGIRTHEITVLQTAALSRLATWPRMKGILAVPDEALLFFCPPSPRLRRTAFHLRLTSFVAKRRLVPGAGLEPARGINLTGF